MSKIEPMVYYGVVEDNLDPLMLGRCRVRVVGVHTALKEEVPIDGLPWAVPLQSITSAAMSGIGFSPTGLLRGSWVLVIFTDPELKQQPIILGSLAGIPVKANVYDETVAEVEPRIQTAIGSDIPTDQPYLGEGTEELPQVAGEIGSLSTKQIDIMLAALRKKESSDNYKAVNTLGYTGAYQFGCAMLEDLGYVKSGTWAKYKRNKVLVTQTDIWSNKDAINSQQAFLNNKAVQDKAARAEMRIWYSRMVKGGLCSSQTPPAELAGLLCVAHLKGTGKGGVRDFINGQATPDAFGTSPTTYYQIGFRCVDSKNPVNIPNQNNVNSSTRKSNITGVGLSGFGGASVGISPEIADKGNPNKLGFIDPSLKYPLDHHINEPDVSRLARNQKIRDTIVAEKEANRANKISIANTEQSWEQPNVPYNARYPYNHVLVTESGHVQEFDDTPNSERIHTFHKSGTFTEIDPSGTQVNRVVGSKVTIVEDDGKVYIMGSGIVTIDGDFAVDVKKALHISIQGDANLHVYGNTNQLIDGDYNLQCTNFNVHCTENLNIKNKITSLDSSEGIEVNSDAKINIQATEDINLKSDAGINTESGSAFNLKSGGALNIEATSDVNAKAGSNVNLQATVDINATATVNVSLQAVAKISQTSLSNFTQASTIKHSTSATIGGGAIAAGVASSAGAASGAEVNEILDINIGWAPELTEYDLTTYSSIEDFNNESAIFEQNGLTQLNESESVPLNVVASADNIIEYPITNATRLSQNFTVGDLVDNKARGIPAEGQHGLSQEQIVINLQNLAVNVLEPIKAAYPDMKINSGFRLRGNSTSKSKGVSQHELGAAVDVGFNKFPPGIKNRPQLFLDRANALSTGLPNYDQLLLEVKSDGKCWIHISYSSVKNRKAVLTLIDNGQAFGGKTFQGLKLA